MHLQLVKDAETLVSSCELVIFKKKISGTYLLLSIIKLKVPKLDSSDPQLLCIRSLQVNTLQLHISYHIFACT